MGKLSKKTKKFVAKGGVDIAKRSNKKRGRKEKLKKGASAEQAHGGMTLPTATTMFPRA